MTAEVLAICVGLPKPFNGAELSAIIFPGAELRWPARS